MRIISGHQAVYLPWPGLFHKLSLCDVFVYMDTVQYLDRDWNNRNKIRTPQGWMWLTVPVDRKSAHIQSLAQVKIKGYQHAEAKKSWQREHWKSIQMNYGKAPFFDDYAGELEYMYVDQVWVKLVDLCWTQFKMFIRWLGLERTEIVRMSEMPFEGSKDELVLEHAVKLNGDGVVFGAMGRDYVRPDIFSKNGIKGYFQSYNFPEYRQRYKGFEPYMSVLDMIMNNGPDSREILLGGNVTKSELISNNLWDF